MIVIDRDERRVVRVHLQTESDRDRLADVFRHAATNDGRRLDLAKQDGFICRDLKAFVLAVVDKMRFEAVSVRNNTVTWTKTSGGWLEAAELASALSGPSHQILGDGDATVEVHLGAG